MEIEEVRLGDLVTFQRGFDISKKEQIEGEVPVISSGGVSSYHNEYKVKAPGIAIGRKGTLGTVHYTDKDYFPHSTVLWIKDFKGNNPRFIYYLLKTLKLEKFDAGAANPTLNRNHIHPLKIKIPTNKYRGLIAETLTSYDSLIENNNRRIAILEEMAEEIYKEWFVRLRFPNWEETKFKDGIPKGWSENSFEEVAEYINGYAFKPKDLFEVGLPIIKISELKKGLGKSTPRNSGKLIPKKYFIENGDILFSWSAHLDAYYWSEGKGLLNQHLFKVIPNRKETKFHILYSLKMKMDEFRSLSNGATMQHIKRSELGRVYFLTPPDNILNKFTKLVKPILEERIILKSKNTNLQKTRDLLLPRLISGKIDLTHLVADTETF